MCGRGGGFLTIPFLEYGHVAYLKGNSTCRNMVVNILPADPSPFPGVGSKGQNSTFSDHGHVAYQIIWNHESNNMFGNWS